MKGAGHFDPGDKLGDLCIQRQIGVGAFGTVYLATDELLQRQVALKSLRRRATGLEDDVLNNALDEARAVARFHHPNIVTLHRLHAIGEGAVVFEMEYLAGGNLAERLRSGWRPSIQHCIDLARGLTLALMAAHAAGVVHGDVKPANVLLDDEGRPKLADFGLARVRHTRVEDSGAFRGTPFYMAPEQLMGRAATEKSDIWGLGLTIFEAATGRYPFPSDGFARLFPAILNDTVRMPEIGIPARLSEFCSRTLEKDPQLRPGLDVLAQLLEGDPGRVTRRVFAEPAPLPNLIGRTAELKLLLDIMAGDTPQRLAGALVIGDAGIGKTTLVESVWKEAQKRNYRCVRVQALPHRSLIASLLRKIRKELHGSTAEGGTRSSKRILLEFLDTKTGALESKGQLLWAIRESIQALAAAGPMILLVEDLHDSTEEDCRFLADLAERLADLGVALIATSRSAGPTVLSAGSDQPDLAGVVNRRGVLREINLGPLSPAEILRTVAEGHQTFDPAVAHRLTQVAEGNPLIAKEFLRYLREVGGVTWSAQKVQPGPIWDAHEIPTRIQQMIVARVDGLAEEDRAILDVAAIAGRRFDPEVVAAVLEIPMLRLLRRLQTLFRSTGLVAPKGERFAFPHGVIHESISQSLAPRLQRELHRLVALQLEGSESVSDEELGRHWLLAGEPERGREFLVRAADLSERRQAIHRAIELYEAAGLGEPDLSTEDTLRHGESLLSLAVCYADRGDSTRAREMLARLETIARSAGQRDIERKALLRRARNAYYSEGAHAVDVDGVRKAVSELERGYVRAMGTYVLGLIAKSRSEYQEAMRLFRESYRDCRADARWSGASDALDQLGTIAKRMGRLGRAERLYRLAAQTSARVGRVLNASVSEFNGALIAFERGCFEGLSERLDASIRVLQIEGNPQLAAHARVIHASILRAIGEGNSARDCLFAAESAMKDIDYLPAQLALHSAWAEHHLDAGDVAASEAALRKARECASAIEAARPILLLDALGAIADACRDRPDEARSTLTRVLDSPVLRADPGAAGYVMFRVAQATLLGVDTRLMRGVRRLRRQVRPHWRAALIAARLLASDGPPLRRHEVAIDRLERGDVADHRAFLRAMAASLRSRTPGLPESDRAALRARSRTTCAHLGAGLYADLLGTASGTVSSRARESRAPH